MESEGQQLVPLTEEQIALTPREELTYSDFRKAYLDIEGKLFGMAEKYIIALDWTDVEAKVETDEELRKERDIFYLVKICIIKRILRKNGFHSSFLKN